MIFKFKAWEATMSIIKSLVLLTLVQTFTCSSVRSVTNNTWTKLVNQLNGHHSDTANNPPKEVAQHFNMAGHNIDVLKLYTISGKLPLTQEQKLQEILPTSSIPCSL